MQRRTVKFRTSRSLLDIEAIHRELTVKKKLHYRKFLKCILFSLLRFTMPILFGAGAFFFMLLSVNNWEGLTLPRHNFTEFIVAVLALWAILLPLVILLYERLSDHEQKLWYDEMRQEVEIQRLRVRYFSARLYNIEAEEYNAKVLRFNADAEKRNRKVRGLSEDTGKS